MDEFCRLCLLLLVVVDDDKNVARCGLEMETPMPTPKLCALNDVGVPGDAGVWSIACPTASRLACGMGGVGGYGGYRVTGLLSGIGGGRKESVGCLLSSLFWRLDCSLTQLEMDRKRGGSLSSVITVSRLLLVADAGVVGAVLQEKQDTPGFLSFGGGGPASAYESSCSGFWSSIPAGRLSGSDDRVVPIVRRLFSG